MFTTFPQAIITIGSLSLIFSLTARFVLDPVIKIKRPWSVIIPQRGLLFESLYNTHLFVNALIIIGGILEFASLLMPWLILNGFLLTLLTVITVYHLIRGNLEGSVLSLIITALHSYCFYLVKSYYNSLAMAECSEVIWE